MDQVNSFEARNTVNMCSSFSYQSVEEEAKSFTSEAFASLLNATKSENSIFRSYFQKLNRILIDTVKTRKSVLERKFKKKDV